MASKMRVEFVRLRDRDSSGIQNMQEYSNATPVTKTVSGTALTGAGRVTVPATVNGNTRFHARIISDVDIVVTIAPPGDDGTSYDATLTEEGGTLVPPNQPTLIPVEPGQLISAITAPYA